MEKKRNARGQFTKQKTTKSLAKKAMPLPKKTNRNLIKKESSARVRLKTTMYKASEAYIKAVQGAYETYINELC